MKKVFCSIILGTLLVTMLFSVGFAVDADISGAEGEQTSSSTGTTISGTVRPLRIKAAVPVDTTMIIDPNEPANYSTVYNDAFTASSVTFKNLCNAPLFYRLTAIAPQSSAPSIVRSDKFTVNEWKDLTKTQTLTNIAVGFAPDVADWKTPGAEGWFDPINGYLFGTLSGQSQGSAKLKMMYGQSWGNSGNLGLKYDVVYEVGISD